MKKILLFITLIMAVAAFTACAAGDSRKETQTAVTERRETQAETSVGNLSAGEGKTLVVYYSATGSTARAAGFIAEATGADTFEIIPAEPYTSADLDWTDRDSRVSREHDDESLRSVELESSSVPDWESYDRVFIGYPIWWGIAAWPTSSFVDSNDFTGKTVIPFCTSTSSGLGESGELLAQSAGTGNWLEGERFRSNADKETVEAWVNSLES